MIAAVTFYSVVVWIHVLAAVVAFGGVFAYPLMASAFGRAGALPAFHGTEVTIWSRVVTGIYLASDADAWSEAWVSASFVGLILLFAIAGMATGWERRAAQLAAAGDAGYDAVASRLRLAVGAAMVLVTIVLFLMIVKP
jgi:hypothetical protein